jgi:class 3 adenylate cyclase/tetratricopeptide (TPR) repeat protein
LPRNIDLWLERIGLARYIPLFTENEIDFDILPDLTEQDLKDLDIPLGPRKKLIKAIAALDGIAAPTIQPETAPAARAEAERRQLTVMFCDLVGSTALSTRFDPEDLREVIRAFQDACTKVITQYGGYVAKYLGDGMLVYFGYPQAHENDAERAVRAGLGIVEAVAKLGTVNEHLRGLELAVRVGINTGLVVVGDIIGEGAAEQASVVGETPNVAARLQQLAEPNHILIGLLTRGLIGEQFVCESFGAQAVHGIADPVPAWRVLRECDAAGVGEAVRAANGLPLVGRQEETGLLLRSWDASKRGRGQVVLIQGEAGIGKSRLVEAMRTRLDDDHVWVATRCSPYHTNTILYPIIEHLKRVMGWRTEDDDARRLKKLESALETRSLPLERAVPLYTELLGLPLPAGRYAPLQLTPPEQREQTLDALAGWLLDEAEHRPVLHVWEDLHWADPTTLELLNLYIEQSPTVAMMNVLTYRADFAVPWTMRSHMTLITLSPLDRAEVERLILQQTGGKAMPAEVIEYIVRKTDGIPLYVEELTKAIREADFVHDAGDRYELTRPLSGVTIPATLQDLLMARLDRLPTVREVAQIGSILGREFAYEMIHAVAAHEELTLQNGLDQLVQAELLYQRGRGPHARYTFKHALVQDAAYHSLLKRTRKYYHQQVGDLLERRYPDIAQSQPDLVAQHYVRAENDEKAVDYLTRSADKAAGLYAHTEAVAALEEAIPHAERLSINNQDRCVLEIVLRLAESLHFLGRRQELVERLLQQQARLDRLADASLAGKFYFWLGFAHSFLGHRAEAQQALGRALDEAARCGDEAIGGRVHRALAMECTFSGQPLEKAVEHGRQAIALLERTADGFWLAQALFALSYASYYQGDFDSVFEAAARLNTLGQATGSRRARANAEMMIGFSLASRGDYAEGIKAEQRALELSPDDFETAWILAGLGKVHTESGDGAQAVPILEQAVALADGLRSMQLRCWFRTILGDAYVLHGDLDKARRVVSKALDVSTDIQFLLGVGLSKQVFGRIARAHGDIAEAIRNFDDAIVNFGLIGARFELARTHLDLATLAQSEGDGNGLRKHARQAEELFSALQVPKYVERAARLGEQSGLSLSA